MVKKRTPPDRAPEISKDDVEAFASGADGGKIKLDPNATRTYKAIKVPFNEYEYKKLETLAGKTGRSKLNAIRWAIIKLAEKEEGT